MLFLLFQLGSDRYALPARDVIEVLPLVAWKEIPGAPRGVAGLIDYRGIAVPVLDLSALALGRPAARRVSTRLFVVRYPWSDGDVRELGLIVEHATEMLQKSPDAFQAAGVLSETARYLGPVTQDARGLIQRIEVAQLLDDELRAALFAPAMEVSTP